MVERHALPAVGLVIAKDSPSHEVKSVVIFRREMHKEAWSTYSSALAARQQMLFTRLPSTASKRAMAESPPGYRTKKETKNRRISQTSSPHAKANQGAAVPQTEMGTMSKIAYAPNCPDDGMCIWWRSTASPRKFLGGRRRRLVLGRVLREAKAHVVGAPASQMFGAFRVKRRPTSQRFEDNVCTNGLGRQRMVIHGELGDRRTCQKRLLRLLGLRQTGGRVPCVWCYVVEGLRVVGGRGVDGGKLRTETDGRRKLASWIRVGEGEASRAEGAKVVRWPEANE
ncbi:hypothetical protein IWZ03DRAFT_408479 [Phyllosticta citriasiana]|uniref:Uncharacterized protein n=1 Tax=Phyllosticta citriasiana TaxID=595635 RepID=A0ABR1KE61_9PEZI